MQDTAWVHNLDPFLVQFSGNMGIRWYGLAYLAGFVIAALLMIFMAKRGRRTIHAEQVTDFITYLVLGTMIGGRVGYALFYSPELLTDFSSSFPFWSLLKVWEGGMASHGGIAGVFIAAVLFARRHDLDWRHLGDLVGLGGSGGIILGRIANFINGELFGREAASWWPWPVKFPGEMYLWLKHDREKQIADLTSGPDLIPRMTEAVTAFGGNLDQWNTSITQIRTSTMARGFVQSMINNLIQAIESGNEAVRMALGPHLTPRYPSQLIEALLEGVLSFLVTFFFWRKPRKPGVVGSIWLTTYCLMRILGEQFRLPDAEIGYQIFGLTRGQVLSFGMLAIGIGLLVYCARRDVPVIGGWGAEARRLRDEERSAGKKAR
ncbi:MAG: prolipoprotein diacylglyceryl transferase [Bdellovibrionota bacterium]